MTPQYWNSSLPRVGYEDDDLPAAAEQDLQSWLLQDDDLQQGFWQEAKEVHSSASAAQLIGGASPPFVAGEVFQYDDFDLDPLEITKFCSEDIIKEHQKEQIRHQQEQFVLTPQTDPFMCVDPNLIWPSTSSPESATSYSFDDELITESFERNTYASEFCLEPPNIIKVPISEVKPCKPVLPKIRISGVERLDNPSNYMCEDFSSTRHEEPKIMKIPKRVVIQLRKVTTNRSGSELSSQIPAIAERKQNASIKNSELHRLVPTFEENFEDCDGELIINEFLKPSRSPNTSSPVQTQESSFGDSSMEELEICDTESNVYSPASTRDSGYSTESTISSPQNGIDDYDATTPSKEQSYGPYRSLEKKLRKKEQNLRAAHKYRQKKKMEREMFADLLNEEKDRRRALLEQRDVLRLEIKTLRNLSKEIELAKRCY